MKEIENYDDSEELNGPDTSGRNWKGIGIALLVIAVICALVILAIVLGAPTQEKHYREGVPLTIDDVTLGILNPSYKEVQWLSGTELLYQSDKDQSIIKHDLLSNTTSTLLSLGASEHIDSYSVSPSSVRKYAFVTQNTQKVYRHTSKAFYKILDLENSTSLQGAISVVPPGKTNVKLQYAVWAPTGDKLVFVYENDIYYKKTPLELSVQMTKTGSTDEKPKVVYNGIPDWLYEEEILSSNHALWWSPGSKYFAYLSFTDTDVETFSFETYGGDSLTQQYVNNTKIRYPKAGTRNPTVSLYVVEPDEAARTRTIPGDTALITPPPEVSSPVFHEFYITTVSWLSESKLFVRYTNRYQNTSVLAVCSPTTTQCKTINTLKPNGGWLEDSPPFSLNNGENLMMLLPNHRNMDAAQHQTVCKMSVDKGPESPVECIPVSFDLTEILAVQPHPNGKEAIYALGTYGAPRYRHIVQIVDQVVTCVTCNLTQTKDCTYYDDVKFSVTKQFLVLTCRGPNVPFMHVWNVASLTSGDTGAQPSYILRSNAELQATIDQKGIPTRKYMEVPLSSLPNGPKAQVELLLPPKMAEYASKRYPLLIKVYGGPGTQEVHTRYRMELEELLASAYETVILRIDARGSGYQGSTFKFHVNRNLGTLEVLDQLEVAKYVLQQHTFLDPTRVGIWGWSYGGYASARAILLDNEPQVIKCAASVAPVTDWRFYDTAYTERFMSTPLDNTKGYDNSNLMPFRHQDMYWHFSRTPFLLIHGTADDNVHFQQAAQFTKAMMKNNILFKTQIYPDEDHSIRKFRPHLYSTLLDHFQTCFGGESIHEKADAE